jgi:hypothetical protein
MKKSLENNTTSRRNFLLGATIGTAGAVAVAVTSGVSEVTATAESQSPAASKAKGYHVTAHIEHYYNTTRNM